MTHRFLLIFFVLPINAWAWQSPEETIIQFLKYELDGGRLRGDKNHWEAYISKYIAAPEGYDEAGFDMVTVVKSYTISPIQCQPSECSAVISL